MRFPPCCPLWPPTWFEEGDLSQVFAAYHKARHRLELLIGGPGQLSDGRHRKVLWQCEGGRILIHRAGRLARFGRRRCRGCGLPRGCLCRLPATSSRGTLVRSSRSRVGGRVWGSKAEGGIADAARELFCHRLNSGEIEQEGGGQVDAEGAAAGRVREVRGEWVGDWVGPGAVDVDGPCCLAARQPVSSLWGSPRTTHASALGVWLPTAHCDVPTHLPSSLRSSSAPSESMPATDSGVEAATSAPPSSRWTHWRTCKCGRWGWGRRGQKFIVCTLIQTAGQRVHGGSVLPSAVQLGPPLSKKLARVCNPRPATPAPYRVCHKLQLALQRQRRCRRRRRAAGRCCHSPRRRPLLPGRRRACAGRWRCRRTALGSGSQRLCCLASHKFCDFFNGRVVEYKHGGHFGAHKV